jgi:hypothetical protein
MAKSTKNLRFRMTKQRDAINKRMREEIKLQRRKQLGRSEGLIKGQLFATLRSGSTRSVAKGRLSLGKKGNHVCAAQTCYQVRCQATWMPDPVESGRLRHPVVIPIAHKKEARWPVVSKYPAN